MISGFFLNYCFLSIQVEWWEAISQTAWVVHCEARGHSRCHKWCWYYQTIAQRPLSIGWFEICCKEITVIKENKNNYQVVKRSLEIIDLYTASPTRLGLRFLFGRGACAVNSSITRGKNGIQFTKSITCTIWNFT